MPFSAHSMVTPRSCGSRKRFDYGDEEVDAVRNPTLLFQQINSGDWEGALSVLKEYPREASVWVSRQQSNNGDRDIAWKYLPLHLVCLQKRPPLHLVEALIQAYPLAASLATPHDGNLAMHYICEGGGSGDLPQVMDGLLSAFPQSLEVKNAKGKTPLLLCTVETRGVLMNVLKMRKNRRGDSNQLNKKNGGAKKKSERRNDSSGSSREADAKSSSTRHAPPSRSLLPPLIDMDSDDETTESGDGVERVWQDEPAFTSANSRLKKNHMAKYQQQPSRVNETNSLRSQLQSLTSQTIAQQQTIEDLNAKLHQLSISSSTSKPSREESQDETIAEDAKILCQRILSKAEADSIKFSSQIQKLQEEKESLEDAAKMEEKRVLKSLSDIKDLLVEKGKGVNIHLFDDDSHSKSSSSASPLVTSISSSGSTVYSEQEMDPSGLAKQIMDAFTVVFSDMERRKSELQSKVSILEKQLSESQVQSKAVSSKNQALRLARDTLTQKQRELERKVNQLEEEKKCSEATLEDMREKNNTLSVINLSLKEQIDSTDACHSDTTDDDEVRANKKDEVTKEQTESLSLLKEQALLREKNTSLKETILLNNEKYLAKVQELGAKYASLEKANNELRQRLIRTASTSSKTALKVSLEGEDELLYEV